MLFASFFISHGQPGFVTVDKGEKDGIRYRPVDAFQNFPGQVLLFQVDLKNLYLLDFLGRGNVNGMPGELVLLQNAIHLADKLFLEVFAGLQLLIKFILGYFFFS